MTEKVKTVISVTRFFISRTPYLCPRELNCEIGLAVVTDSGLWDFKCLEI